MNGGAAKLQNSEDGASNSNSNSHADGAPTSIRLFGYRKPEFHTPIWSDILPRKGRNDSSSSSNDCPLDYTGYYATAGCTSYVYCQAGNVVGAALPCVPGTLFDTTISTCAYAENVNCGN